MESTLAKNFPWTAGAARLIWPEGPARRKRWVVVAAVILLLVLAHTLWTAIASARLNRVTDRIGGRWDSMALSTLAPPEVDDRDNAAKPVRAAGELLYLPAPVVGERDPVRAYGSYEVAELLPDELETVRAVVEDNALVLRVLDEAVDRTAANWDLRYEQGVRAEIPNLMQILNLAKLNAAAGRLALRDGRTDDVTRAIERGAAIAHSLALEPLVIIQIVRASVQRYHTALLHEWLSRGEADPASLASLADLWTDRHPDNPLERAVANEAKAMAAVMLERTPETDNSEIAGLLGLVLRPVVIDNVRVYLELMDRVVVCATLPRHEREPSCTGDRGVEAFSSYYFLAKVMVFDFAATFDRVDVARSSAAQATVAIALERYRLQHGTYPDVLAALAPDWLESVPTDPLTGGAFAYERTGDGYGLTTEAELDSLLAGAPQQRKPVLEWTIER